jgi:predicted aminopeptidase
MKSILLIFLFLSCAKISYVLEQGAGQVSLEYNDIDNEDFVADETQDKEHRRKVELIVKAKSYFYDYFNLASTDIYDEVKILENEAVTYLVIHSPKDKIKAVEISFPLVGRFPYLGFFKKNSAVAFKEEKENEGYHTYMRNVYAYSTLNHPLLPMDDNILSSFFYYRDEALVRLIFHELVHTIIFVKDNVSFNENLAEFISDQMAIEYFNIDLNSIKRKKQKELNQKIRLYISSSTRQINQLYKSSTNHEKTLSIYMQNKFIPAGKVLCDEFKMNKCLFEDGDWNNARFAAYGTYTEKQDELLKLFKQENISLKTFTHKLIKFNNVFDPSKGNFLSQIKKDF